MRIEFIKEPEDKIDTYVEEVRRQHLQNLNGLMEEIARKLGRETMNYLNPQTHLLRGSPRKEVPEFANKINADLVVMGTVARTGISGVFMGNTAETILNKLNCSILAIKPPGFKTPVTLND